MGNRPTGGGRNEYNPKAGKTDIDLVDPADTRSSMAAEMVRDVPLLLFSMKPFWEMTDADIKACLNATDWCRADYEYFRGGGYSSHFRCKAEMPVTMLRFNIVEGIGPVLQIAEGWTADLPDEIHNTIDKRTDPTWPTTWFCPRLTGQGAFTDVYSVMANWGANHGVTVYGHVGADLITLASMLRIPVTMHNVPAEKVYRPHAWASFGTQDQQAADYAACKQYGPLYR